MLPRQLRSMLMRRKFVKRFAFTIIISVISVYATVLLFGDLKSPAVLHLTDLHRCPACYGISICPELYSTQITIDANRHWSKYFNAKNIFYGITNFNRKVVLKKLAHNKELKEFDNKLCERWKLKNNCKPADLMNVSNVEEEIERLVSYNISYPEIDPRRGLVMCPYGESIHKLVEPILTTKKNYKSEMLNIWTMLSLNPEPIVLHVIRNTFGWPVPPYAGVCGRLEVLGYEGEPISAMVDIPWLKRLKYAKDILDAALDFTYKHERYRFYLMDWSLDNIVVDAKDKVTFIDLEDIIVLDKHTIPKDDLGDWYQRYNRENPGPGFTFSIENLCKHHLSDHNLWAACYILAGDENPLLIPVPKSVNSSKPHFERLLTQCVNHNDRFRTVSTLQLVIADILSDSSLVGSDVR